MAAPLCTTNVDNQYFTIYYHRGDAIVYSAGPMTYAFVASTLASLKAAGLEPIAVTSSGPGGNYTYAASGFSAYLKQFGGGNPWPAGFGGDPGGLIDDNGNLYCTPPPASTGGSFSCPLGYYYDPETELCIPTPSPPGFPPAPIGIPLPPGFPPGGNPPPPQPNNCQIAGNVPMVNGACPIGYEADPNDEGCCRPILSTGPPPVGPPAPGPISQADPEGDEITSDLCAQMGVYTSALINAINGIGGPGGAAPDPTCCANVVTAIGAVAFQINAILRALPNLTGGAPLDLTQIVTELTAMAVSLNALATAPAPDLTPLTTAINDVAKAIASAPPADVSGIVKALNTIADQGDVDQGIIDAMGQQGFLTPADVQVLQGIKWSDAIAYALSGAPIRFVFKMLTEVGADEVTLVNQILNFAAPGINWAEQKVQDALAAERNILLAPIKVILEKVKAALQPVGVISVGGVGVDPDQALADVATAMLDLKLMAMLVAAFREGAGEQFEKLSEKILAIIGLEEIREVQLGPLVRHGIAKVAEFQAKALYRQELPGASSLAGMQARGLIAPGLLTALYPSTGLPSVLEAATTQGAYSGFNARQMLRLIETNLFSAADIADELTFAGMRPVSQHRMLLAAPYLATATQRNQARSALENAYKEGLLADGDLTAQLDSLEANTDRDSLILFTLHQDVATSSTKELVAEYASLLKVGIWTDAQFRAQLAGLGLQQWKIDLEAGKAEAAANVATFKKNLAEAAALERATVAEERKAAMAGFKSGALNATTLAASLSLTGLTPTQSAAWVALAELQQSGALRWIFGLLKSPAEASLLRGRVTALADQRKRLQIDDPTFVGALQALGLPDRYINSLRAATDAMISPKTAAVTIPVQTT